MKEDILALIKYRLEEAENSIKEAEVLLKEGMSVDRKIELTPM